MDILFHTFWYPYKGSIDGVFIKEHAESCQVAGCNVAIQAIKVLPGKSLLSIKAEYLVENNIPVYYLVIHSVFWKFIYVLIPLLTYITKRHYKKHIAQHHNPAIVVSNVINPAGITGNALAKSIGAKHVIIEHWTRIANFMAKNIFAAQAKQAYSNANAVVSVSGYLKNITIQYGVNPNKAFVIPNVIDADNFIYQPKAESNKLVFCCITNLKYPKNPFLVIDALQKIALTVDKKIVLNIVGDGEYRGKIEQLIPTLNFELNLLGYMPKNKVATVLHGANYFLHASYLETFSLVVAEAVCTGTPVVASNIQPLDDLVTPQTGILAENTVEGWVDAINKVIATHYNMEQQSNAYRSKFSKQGVGNKFIELFNTL